MFVERGCRLTVVPPTTSQASDVWQDESRWQYFLSNGPGDPGHVIYAIQAIKENFRHTDFLFLVFVLSSVVCVSV